MIVVVSGNPRPGSRTRELAVAAGTAVAAGRDAGPPVLVDVADLGPLLLAPGRAPEVTAALATIRAAELLIVATPTYKASYTGVLKVLLDGLPPGGLAGIDAAPVVTAADGAQAARARAALVDLLTELGAACVGGDLTVVESRLADPDAIAAAGADLAASIKCASIAGGPVRAAPGPA